MTLPERLSEIEQQYNYWVASYERKDLNTNQVRIVAESVCKAIILVAKNDNEGTKIILGKSLIPSKRKSKYGALPLVDLIETLRELNIFKNDRTYDLQLETLRSRTNPGSHSSNSTKDDTTLDDLEVCNSNIKSILIWFYKKILNSTVPAVVQSGFYGKPDKSLLTVSEERWNEFEIMCHKFDTRRYQFIFVSPPRISEDQYTVQQFAKLPWRLVVDFNSKTDDEYNGILFNFNILQGQGYKKAFTVNDKIDFDPGFKHYWFLANGQGSILPIAEFKLWRNQYKKFLSDQLYKAFNKGSRALSRVVVMLAAEANYAEEIVEEFNRMDEPNLQFILCSEDENYERIFERADNVQHIKISAIDIANGINSKYNAATAIQAEGQLLIPNHKDDKQTITPINISQDHYDYLHSLGIEIVYKDIEKTIPSDEENQFYKGSTITWRDLAEQRDVSRYTLEIIERKLDSKLDENKLEEIQLVHEAGAGGTTLSRRIAYNFSTKYPTVILKKYHHKRTIEGLRIIYDQYTKGRLPILIVIESFEVKDSHLLYKDLSNAKKNAVLLVVHRGSSKASLSKKFFLKAQLEGKEILAFQNTYVRLCPEKKEQVNKIPFESADNPKYISPVTYALTAFGKDYNGLESYVAKCLDGINLEQKKIACFICLIYHYTQRSVPGELFSSVFNVDRSKCDLLQLLGRENPLLELLHEDSDDHNYNIWRPRYTLLGEEAMKTVIAGGASHKQNWKHHLARWLVDLINYIKLSMPNLDDETNQIINSLFIERSYTAENIQDKEFTKAINDLASPSDGVAIFEALTNAYPDEAHFHGHYARYLYNDRKGIRDYDRAIEEAELSLEIGGDNSSLFHTLGMCYREKAEDLIRNHERQGIEPDEAQNNVKELTDRACDYFDKCIDSDPYNIYGYDSQIRAILKSLDFGFNIHQASSKESFITNPQNSWYAERLDKVSRLLEEALYVIEQSKKLENKERTEKSAGYVYDCQGLFFRTLGKHLAAKTKFEDLIKNTPSGYEYMRPHYRRMFVMCLLASKSKTQKDIFNGWAGISESELNQCVQYLDANVFEDPNNTQNIRLWLQAIRYLKNPEELISCISKIGAWTQITEQNANSLLEGYYYLYVLNAIKAISEGNTFDPTAIQTVKDVQEKMRPFTKNEKFCYEWYGPGKGIQQMVSHKKLGDFTNDFFEKNRHFISEVSGRIKIINSSQQGTIILDCGLEAFFVPNVGGFTTRNQNDKVKCFIGFRYDQIQAWSVISADSNRDDNTKKQEIIELHDLIDDLEDESSESREHSKIEGSQVSRIELPVLSGPKIIGKINLESDVMKVNTDKKPDGVLPKYNDSYSGLVKSLRKDSGYIQVETLDKDIAFNQTHCQGFKFKDLTVNMPVKVKVSFINIFPKTDTAKRNYIALVVTR